MIPIHGYVLTAEEIEAEKKIKTKRDVNRALQIIAASDSYDVMLLDTAIYNKTISTMTKIKEDIESLKAWDFRVKSDTKETHFESLIRQVWRKIFGGDYFLGERDQLINQINLKKGESVQSLKNGLQAIVHDIQLSGDYELLRFRRIIIETLLLL
jgi:hypothetical protein